jgi:hypothetical protein
VQCIESTQTIWPFQCIQKGHSHLNSINHGLSINNNCCGILGIVHIAIGIPTVEKQEKIISSPSVPLGLFFEPQFQIGHSTQNAH